MVISISSCLKPSSPPTPPPPPSPSPWTRTTPAPYWSRSKEASWRSRCVATAACIIIGSAAGFAGSGGAVLAGGDLQVVEGSGGRVVRWSDKRKCPPWHANSLENIVPEDLPRPSPGRRSNGIVAHKIAPSTVGGVFVQYKDGCYSL